MAPFGRNMMAREGRTAKMIEEETSRWPSDLFLWGALGTFVGAGVLHAFGKRETGNLVSQVAPMLLVMGLYNKIVKLEGSE